MTSPKNLLILDPSPSMCALISRIAEESGWQPFAVADLADAEAAIAAREYHAITTASQLPSADYVQVLTRLRAHPRLEFTPIALITGDAADEYVEEALAAGITEIFSKAQLGHFQIYLQGLTHAPAVPEVPDGLRALILDDEGSVGAYVAEVLGDLGLQTTLTQRIEDALAAALEQRFDLIVVDLVLKDGESGNQFIRLLRAAEGVSSQASIVAISGYTDPVRRQEAIRSGANTFLSKPFSADELQHQVVRLLQPRTSSATPVPCPERSNRFNLSQRERMICAMVMAGHPDKYIAKQLTISFWTVRAHIGRIFRKCGVGNRVELGNLLRLATPAASRPDAPAPAMDNSNSAQNAVIDWLSLASHVVDGMQHGIMVLDLQRKVIYANPPLSTITGYSMSELLGKPALAFFAERYTEGRIETILAAIDRDGSWSGKLWGARKNGDGYLANVAVRRMPPGMPMGAVYSVEINDVTEQHRQLEEVSHHAMHDPLTGLPNRTLLKNRGEQEIHRARRSQRPFAVLYLDLDGFKRINDSDGHAYGDLALIEITRRLSALLRKSDTLARIGGDEFVALIPDLADTYEAERIAAKLVSVLAEPVRVEGRNYTLGASIGISLFPDHSQMIDELLTHADRAMYKAKGRGGNTVQRHGAT